MNRIEILQKSIKKKELKIDEKIASYFSDVKSANGQPLNDKRGGRATMDRWERKNQSIAKDIEGLKKSKDYLEYLIHLESDCRKALEVIGNHYLVELLEKNEIQQWKKHPFNFFCKDFCFFYDKKKQKWFFRRNYKGSSEDVSYVNQLVQKIRESE